MGSTTSCSGPCFQWAIAPLDGSEAMRNGAVLSTRAISTSAGRRSAFGKLPWRASDATGRFFEGSRKIRLAHGGCSLWEGHALAPPGLTAGWREAVASGLPVIDAGKCRERSARVLGAVWFRRLSQSRRALSRSCCQGRRCDIFGHGYTERPAKDDCAMTGAYHQSHDQVASAAA